MTDAPATNQVSETDLSVGPQVISNYRRMSYTMWHALAEFIDNSTQSRANYEGLIDEALKEEGQPLTVKINYARIQRELTIWDNSIGMTKEDLIAALQIARPTADSRGRSKYGMGLKTAACWIGDAWTISTCELGSGEEWTAEVDVDGVASGKKRIPLTMKPVGRDLHYTKIVISKLNRNIQRRTEETIRNFLGSMYRYDIEKNRLKLLFDDTEIPAPGVLDLDTDASGNLMKTDIPELIIGGKRVTGWFGVMRRGGRQFGGFSLFQNERQIQGYPTAWKPVSIYGGVDREGANNLVSQRLTGVLNLDGFQVSQTKDMILFENDEEDELEKELAKLTAEYRNYANSRRNPDAPRFTREKIRDLVSSLKKEFTVPEMGDAVHNALLPPFETIVANGQRKVETLSGDDELETITVASDLQVKVTLEEKSENDLHVMIEAGAQPGTMHVVINGLHPYYASLDFSERMDECIRQYIFEAIAEFRVSKLMGRVDPKSARRIKSDLLRVGSLHAENLALKLQEESYEAIVTGAAGV